MTGPMQMANGTEIPPSGKSFELDFCTVARWDDGQIVEENLFYDLVGFHESDRSQRLARERAAPEGSAVTRPRRVMCGQRHQAPPVTGIWRPAARLAAIALVRDPSNEVERYATKADLIRGKV